MNEHVARWLKTSTDPRAVVARVFGSRLSHDEAVRVVALIRWAREAHAREARRRGAMGGRK